MAVQMKDGGKPKQKRNNFLNGGRVSFFSGARNVLNTFLKAMIVVLFFLFAFGFINQARTGENMIAFYKKSGRAFANEVVRTFKGDSSVVDITDNGVYVKGHSPEGSNKIDLTQE